MKKCPNCKLAHADYAENCDCGYSFKDHSMPSKKLQKTGLITKIVTWAAIIVIAPIFAAIVTKALGVGRANRAVNISDHKYEQVLQKISKEMNAGLPMTVDAETRIDRTSAGPGKKVTYFYTLTNVESTRTDIPALRKKYEPGVVNNYCTSPDMKNFRADGVIVAYEYNDRNGNPLMGIVAYPRDCS